MAELQAPERKLFFSKNDPRDPRLGELALSFEKTSEVMVIGYPDDEGVRLNGGRDGAALGPDAIREFLYKTTPHPTRRIRPFSDAGNLRSKGDLPARHESAQEQVGEWLARDQRVLSLGGGNDYAFADGIAFLRKYQGLKPLVINVDAHLDVRDMSRGMNSGTPFFRLLESGIVFDFVELGAQSQCNSKTHWEYVTQKGGQIISYDEIIESGRLLRDYVAERMGELLLRRRPTFLALDIDAFAWPYAAGSSAAWPLGLEPAAFWPLYLLLLKRLDVRMLGIYEVAPGLEKGNGTSKLAAQLAHGFLHDV